MLTLYFHPLASFCWKVLAALYENATPFEPHLVDLADPPARAALLALWPLGKFPVLRDGDRTIPESTIIIEYLAHHHPGPVALIPADADLAREVRLRDRFFDLYVHAPMQKIVLDHLRPTDQRDPLGVEQARAQLRVALDFLERDLGRPADTFTLADCAAGPALYYADRVQPFTDSHPNVAAYLRRLLARPSFARILREAEPYFASFPA